jgi:hypothetical protein
LVFHERTPTFSRDIVACVWILAPVGGRIGAIAGAAREIVAAQGPKASDRADTEQGCPIRYPKDVTQSPIVTTLNTFTRVDRAPPPCYPESYDTCRTPGAHAMIPGCELDRSSRFQRVGGWRLVLLGGSLVVLTVCFVVRESVESAAGRVAAAKARIFHDDLDGPWPTKSDVIAYLEGTILDLPEEDAGFPDDPVRIEWGLVDQMSLKRVDPCSTDVRIVLDTFWGLYQVQGTVHHDSTEGIHRFLGRPGLKASLLKRYSHPQ